MLIKALDLGLEVKEALRAAIKKRLIQELHTLPLASETSKVMDCITGEFKTELDALIINYYEQELGIEVDCKIEAEDYVKIYLNRI